LNLTRIIEIYQRDGVKSSLEQSIEQVSQTTKAEMLVTSAAFQRASVEDAQEEAPSVISDDMSF